MLASTLLFTFVFVANACAFGVELTKNGERPLMEKKGASEERCFGPLSPGNANQPLEEVGAVREGRAASCNLP